MASSEEEHVAMVIKRSSFEGSPIVDACSNSECIALVTSDLCVYTCDLTDGSTHQTYVKVNFPTSEEDDDNDIDIVSVCCGRYHYLALSDDGLVFSWGRNNYGQLGFPKKKQKHRGQDQEKQAPKPRLITELASYSVIKIACGDNHSLALTLDGRVFSWGSNGHGQLGIGEEWRFRHHNAEPTEIKGLVKDIRYLAAGGAHTVVISASDCVHVWGRNSHRQLGLGMEEDVKLPVWLKSVQGNVKRISCGENHTSFLFENGELRVLGMGAGTLRYEFKNSQLSPARADRSYLYSSLQAVGRFTFVTDESSGRPFVLNHEEVRQQEPSQDLQLDLLEESTFEEVFGPDVLPEWPPGCDKIEVELWKVKKSKSQDGDKETVNEGRARGVVCNRDSNQESWRRVIVIQHEERMGKHSQRSFAQGKKIPTLSIGLLQSLSNIDDPTIEMDKSASLHDAKTVFSSPACLNASFPETGPLEVNGLNMDLKAARQAFKLIARKKELLKWISELVCTDLCKNIKQTPCFDEDLRFYLVLLACPIFRYPQLEWSRRVLAAVGRLMIYSDFDDDDHRGRLAKWWKFEPMSFRETVTAYREAVVLFARKKTLQTLENDNFKTCLQALKYLNQINLQHDIVSLKTFYISELSVDDLNEDMNCFIQTSSWSIVKLWSQLQSAVGQLLRFLFFVQGFSWLSYPFLIDLQTKASFLEFHCKTEQKAALPANPHARLRLIANRDDIFGRSVRKQLDEMLGFQRTWLQIPLIVFFERERGLDGGALSIDFFQLVFDELLDPEKNDLFRYINEQDPSQSKVWFREECSSTKTAMMCGLLFGLSLYNQALVPLPAFPQLLYAKLLGKGPKSEMEELEELDKDYADQMSKLLNGSEEEVMEICYGEELELDNGESVEITKANVHLFVEEKVRHFLAPSQFAAFQTGFNRVKVWDTSILEIFRPTELEALVIGEEYYNWDSLEKSTRYVVPYTDSHPTIKMFWEVFHALDDDMKRKFLVFVAGSDRVPVGGLQNLGLTISELPVPTDDDEDDSREDRLSKLCLVAHCCDNDQYNRTLRLPMYYSKELIEDRLMTTLSFYNCPFHIA